MESEKHVLFESNSVEAIKDLRMMSLMKPKIDYRSEIDLNVNSNMHYLKEVQNIQPDKDSSAHEEGAMTGETLPELKDISFEAENEVPE